MVKMKELVKKCADALLKVEGIEKINQSNNYSSKNNNYKNNNSIINDDDDDKKNKSTKNIQNIQQINNYDNSVKVIITGENIIHPITNKPISQMIEEKIIKENTPYKVIEPLKEKSTSFKGRRNEGRLKEEEKYMNKLQEYCQILKDLKEKYNDGDDSGPFKFVDQIIKKMEEDKEYIFLDIKYFYEYYKKYPDYINELLKKSNKTREKLEQYNY